jgi:hypothetical protein
MLQSYHAMPVSVVREDAEDERGAEDEGSALLGNRTSSVGLAKSEMQKDGHATLMSSVSNLANTIIGSGASRCMPAPPPIVSYLLTAHNLWTWP